MSIQSETKLESVLEIIQNTFDIFLVCETKIDSSFPNQQFLFYVNQDLNCKVLNKYPMCQDLEILILELKLSKTNWLVIGT